MGWTEGHYNTTHFISRKPRQRPRDIALARLCSGAERRGASGAGLTAAATRSRPPTGTPSCRLCPSRGARPRTRPRRRRPGTCPNCSRGLTLGALGPRCSRPRGPRRRATRRGPDQRRSSSRPRRPTKKLSHCGEPTRSPPARRRASPTPLRPARPAASTAQRLHHLRPKAQRAAPRTAACGGGTPHTPRTPRTPGSLARPARPAPRAPSTPPAAPRRATRRRSAAAPAGMHPPRPTRQAGRRASLGAGPAAGPGSGAGAAHSRPATKGRAASGERPHRLSREGAPRCGGALPQGLGGGAAALSPKAPQRGAPGSCAAAPRPGACPSPSAALAWRSCARAHLPRPQSPRSAASLRAAPTHSRCLRAGPGRSLDGTVSAPWRGRAPCWRLAQPCARPKYDPPRLPEARNAAAAAPSARTPAP